MINKKKTYEELSLELLELQQSHDLLKEKYAKSEERLQIAFETSSDSININRLADGMYVYINEGFTRSTGYTEVDVINKTSVELNIWVDKERRETLVKELKEKGRVENFEAKFQRKDGSVLDGMMSASLIEIDGVTHILNVTSNITDIKKLDDESERNRILIDALMNNLEDYIWIKDRKSRFTRINKSHSDALGLNDPDEVKGKTDLDFYSEEHSKPGYEDEQNIIRTGQPVYLEEKLTKEDGSDQWVISNKLPMYDPAGNIVGVFGISKNITAQKRVIQENQVLYEITQGITETRNLDELLKLIHHSIGKIVYADNFFVALHNSSTGLFSFPYFVDEIDETPQPLLMDKSCSAYVFRKLKPFLFSQDVYDRLVEQNEVELVGSESPSWIGIPLQTSSKAIGVMVLQHYEKEGVYTENDMRLLVSIGNQVAIAIERKKAEEEILLKNELLQAIISEKDKFFSIMAHDLRGPLSAFVAATQILTEEIQTMDLEEVRDITESMKTSATNIYNLLENLLEWSRLKRGTMDFDPVVFNLKKRIEDCLAVLSESAVKKEISIDFSVHEGIDMYADIHMFDTILRNLVSNALKFTHVGGKVSINAIHEKEDGIQLNIVDSGIGMTSEIKDRLFIINEKTSRQGTAGEPSTGLGLLLCREFVEKHGGKIWVESEVGKGSVFSIIIPVKGIM